MNQELEAKMESLLDNGIYKSPYDTRSYRYQTLKNGIKLLIISDIHDSEEFHQTDTSESDDHISEQDSASDYNDSIESPTKNTASIAVCVHSGYLNDPPDIPGLSHFLEHMLFMGSEKFPDPSDFGDFISGHGGNYNAYTCMEQVNFFFSLPIQFFDQALERFAHFFISPLLVKETMESELIAVDNEFQSARMSDELRSDRLLQLSMIPDHPASYFSNGNLITLKTNIDKCAIDLRERVKQHWEHFYAPQIMSAVIFAPTSLNIIEQSVLSHLNNIPIKDNLKPSHSFSWTEVFDSSKFHLLYRYKTIAEKNILIFSWITPPQIKLYKTKPLHFISFILGYEGEGSLFSYLKNCRNLIYKLSAGISPDGSSNNSHFSIFRIQLELSEKGVNNIEHIVESVFSYIRLMRCEQSLERIFKEVQIQSYHEFIFAHLNQPCQITSTIASNMNVYEPEDSLMGSYLFFSFDLNAILEGISFLAFDNVNIMLGSHNFQFEKFETEFWFDINYTSEEFPSSWPHFSQNFEISPTMFLPKPNIFMPSCIELILPDIQPSSIPELIMNTNNCRLYYMYDSVYKLPKCVFNFCLRFSTNQPEKMHALLYLYCFSFTFLYQEKIYEAEMANITFVWNLQIFGGVSFHFEGYENKIDTLIYYIFDKFLSFNLDEDMFLRLKTKIINNWNNSLQKQHKYIKNLIYHLLCRNSKTIMDLLEELKTLTYSHFINFQNNFKSLHMFVDLLVCGCISSHKAKSILEKVINKLNAPVLEFKQFSRLHFIDLPIGSCLYRIPSKVKSDKMVTVCNIYQFGIVSYDVYCAIVILNHLLAPLVFKILRDQEQLGYDVYAQLSFAHHVPSIALVVVSDVNKNTPNFIDQRIENLIDNFINSLSLMSESDFKRKIEGLVQTKTQMDASLEDMSARFFEEIVGEKYVFDRKIKDAKELSLTPKNLIIELAQRYLSCNSSNRSKLSIQIIGGNNVDLNEQKDMWKNNNNYENLLINENMLQNIYPNEIIY